MKRPWNKALAALMALAMVLSLCVIPAGAEEETGVIPEPVAETEQKTQESEPRPKVEEAVAQIGETKYATLELAVAAAQEGATITLLSNVTLATTLKLTQSLTIEGDYSITAAESFAQTGKNALIWVNGGEVTLNNTKVDANGKSRAILADKGKLTIDGTHVNGGYINDGYIAGVYVTNAAAFEMKSGAIVGNTIAGTYAADGYLQYSADLWIGANAKGTLAAILGGTVGNIFVNSNEYSANNPGAFTLDGGTVENLYVEYDKGYGGSFTYTDGTLTNLHLATLVSGVSMTATPVKGTAYVGGVVAKIDGIGYRTLADAVTAANNNTITLLGDITEDVVIPSGKTVTLDLNGHTLTSKSGDTITNKGTLTVADTSAEKTGVVQCDTAGKSALLNDVGGTATLDGGKFYKDRNIDSNDYYVITNHGTQVTINDGVVIESTSTHSSAIENGWYTASQNSGATYSTMVINGGTMTASGGLYTVKNDDYGVMTINGGTYTNTASSHGCVLNWNELTITGGTFHAANSAVATMAEHNTDGTIKYPYEKGATVITGGTFNGTLGRNDATPPGSVSISGGTFSTDPTAYLASGYSIRESNGSYVVYRPSSGGGSGSTVTPPKTETETTTDGDVTTKTETTTTTNKDGSKTTEVKETTTNAATGEKTESKLTETVAKDGSVIKEEIKTTTTADGVKTEEKTTATVDAKTGTSATTTVKTDETGKTAADIVVENSKDAKEVTLSAEAVQAAAKADEAVMTIKTAGTEITLDAPAIAAVAAAKGETVSITVETVTPEALPRAAQEALKDATVVDLSIRVGGSKVSAFNGGKATVSVSYTKSDSAKLVAVYYVDDAGALTRIPGAAYDAKNKRVRFTTGHFSYYAVTEEAALAFADVKDGDWYYDAVRYVTEAKLFQGTGETTFSPGGTMTREMLATVLYRKAGSPTVSGLRPGSFVDGAEISAWAETAMSWAVQEGILTGVGENRLDPQGAVTRQQLAVILHRASGSPKADGVSLSTFADGGSVAGWAADGMTWAVADGIITGRNGNTLAPAGTASRAEVATMLMRLA